MLVATLLKNMIGSGIFSLPLGLLHATRVPGLLVLFIMGTLSASSFWMIGYCCITWGVTSFRDLWYRVFGLRTAWIIDVTMFFNGWFTLVAYVVLIGDFTTKSFEGLLGEDSILATGRKMNQWTITVLLLLPLSLAKDLSKLAFTSMLGLVILAYVYVLVMHDSATKSPAEWGPDMVASHWNLGIFEAIALYTHAFVAHYNAPKLLSELYRPTYLRWLVVVGIAYAVALVTYCSFAWAGLRRFEGELLGNILRNYESNYSVLLAWLGMGFCIAFTYPLVFNSMREAAVNLVQLMKEKTMEQVFVSSILSPRADYSPPAAGGLLRRGSRTASLINVLGMSPDAMRPSGTKPSRGPGRRSTVLLVFMTAAVGTQCEDVGLVNALAGSVMGVLICMIFPGMFFMQTARLQLRAASGNGLSRPLLGQASVAELGEAFHAKGCIRSLLPCFVVAGGITVFMGVIFAAVGTAVVLKVV